MSNGLNFQPEGNVYASVTHLQHNDFQYILNVENDTVQQKSGTIRIFIAQKCDVRDRPLTIIELRHLMIELDRFEVDRKSQKIIFLLLNLCSLLLFSW